MCRVRDLAPKQEFNQWFQDLSQLKPADTFLPPYGNMFLDPMYRYETSTIDPTTMLLQNPAPASNPSCGNSSCDNFVLDNFQNANMYSPESMTRVVTPPASVPSATPVAKQPASKKRAMETMSDEEKLILKRQKQNAAASRCRQKKADQIANLESQVVSLEKEKFELSLKLAVLQQEKKAWLTRENCLEKDLLSLQGQLDLAQRALLQK